MDPEAIKGTLQRLEDLPSKVSEWKVEVGEDATGDPAIWVWATLVDSQVGPEIRQAIRERVRHVAGEAAALSPEPWVYVRVLERSEEPSR